MMVRSRGTLVFVISWAASLLLAFCVLADQPQARRVSAKPQTKAKAATKATKTTNTSKTPVHGTAAARTAKAAAGPPQTPAEPPSKSRAAPSTKPSAPPVPQEVVEESEWIPEEPLTYGHSTMLTETMWDGYGIDTTCGIWAELDYLLWRRKGRDFPALVTTDPDGGVLPAATVLFGNDEVGDEVRPGGRVRIGTFLDRCHCWSVEGSFLMLADGDERFEVDSSTTPTIARPFFNLTQDLQGSVVGEDALQVAASGISTGILVATSDSDVMMADALLRSPLCQSGTLVLDCLAGYQFARIDEDLLIASSSALLTNNATIDLVDSFATENEFHGGVLGLELARICNRWDLQLLGKVALGNMRQEVSIEGSQVVTVGGVSSTTAGGLLAQPTNIGTFERNVFAVVPEVALTARYHLTCHLEVMAGYSFISFNRVAQPGDQIDLSINPNQPPPSNEAQRPAFTFRDSDYFLHGAHAGLQWSF